MKVLGILATKGGAGKTTLAAHLAVAAERVGDGPAFMCDLDPQGSLLSWYNRRKADSPYSPQRRSPTWRSFPCAPDLPAGKTPLHGPQTGL